MTKIDLKTQLELVLSKEEAKEIFLKGEEAVTFKLMELSACIKQMQEKASTKDLTTPSGMIPPYEKPTGKKRKKKPGRKNGHPGSRRPIPLEITDSVEHTAKKCPHCDNPVDPNKPVRKRKRIIEDIQEAEPVVTEHTVHGYWCPSCKKTVEPIVEDAFPKAAVGHRTVALTAWLHYGLGITLSHIVEILNHHFHFQVSAGGLIQMWYRIQEILFEWYEEIGEEAKTSSVLHSDESGWRVNAVTHWLWCFTNKTLTYYMIEDCRGSPVLFKFFGDQFDGCLISDFWAAYDMIGSDSRQYCIAHLLREIEKIDIRNQSEDWCAFSKKLKRLIGDALRLNLKRGSILEEEYQSKNKRLDGRLENLVFTHNSDDADVKRLSVRLSKSIDGIFTFLDRSDVDPTNNRAEREIRPAVVIRKNSLGNKSEKGASCQAVLMSIYRTLRLRGYDPVNTVVDALKEYVKTGKISPLPTVHR